MLTMFSQCLHLNPQAVESGKPTKRVTIMMFECPPPRPTRLPFPIVLCLPIVR